MTCSHCGLSHPSDRCNRPEGIASRGGRKLKLSDHSLAFVHAPARSLRRGRRIGGRSAWSARRVARALGASR